jgi:preprotein translocase subunit SecF
MHVLHLSLCCLQARCAAAYEGFELTLSHNHGTVATEAEQQQVAAAKAELQQQLSAIAATAVQQVKARAAAAVARQQAAAGGQSKQQEQAAAAVLQSFVEQLQSVEDGWMDVPAAQQACTVRWTHLAFKPRPSCGMPGSDCSYT